MEKRGKKLLLAAAVLFALAMLAAAVSAADVVASGYCGGDETANYVAEEDCYDNLTWTLDSDGVLTIDGEGKMKDYSEKYDSSRREYITTALWGKYMDSLKKLVLGEGITSIGNLAFYYCSDFMGRLVLPESLTSIGQYAFLGCYGFTGRLEIPGGVTEIGVAAFEECRGFTGNLILPTGMTQIKSQTFYECTGFNGELVLPEGVTDIGSYAFYYCSGFKGNLVIPDGVNEIGSGAFYSSGFTGNLILPDSLTSIENESFGYCRFTGTLRLPENLVKIGDSSLSGNNFTGNLIVPESVTSIGRGALYGFKSIYFQGDAPIAEYATASSSFNSNATLYYLESASGWTDEEAIYDGLYDPETGLWRGYKIAPYSGKIVTNIAFAPDVKTEYEAGEHADDVRIVVTYEDGTTETLTRGFDQSPAANANLTTSNRTLTVTYSGCTISLPITVRKVSSSAARFSLTDATGTQSQQICVPVSITYNPGFTGLELDVTYDPAILTLTDVIDTGLIPGATHAPDYASPYLLSWENDLETRNFTASGTAAYLVFTVNADAPAGEVSVRLTIPADGVISASGNTVEAAAAGCTVTVTDFLCGDVNSDGEVTPLDRMILARYLARWADYPAPMVNASAADVNLDGQLTSKDRMILARYLAGWSGYEALPFGAAPVPVIG